MIELIISSLIGMLSGVVSFVILTIVAFGGIFGGDMWHPDWSAGLWWLVPIIFFAIDICIFFLIQKYSNLHFTLLAYILLVVFYIAAMVVTLLVIR